MKFSSSSVRISCSFFLLLFGSSSCSPCVPTPDSFTNHLQMFRFRSLRLILLYQFQILMCLYCNHNFSFYSITFFLVRIRGIARAIHLVVSERMSHYHSQVVHLCSSDNKDLQHYKGVHSWVYRLICSDARLSS